MCLDGSFTRDLTSCFVEGMWSTSVVASLLVLLLSILVGYSYVHQNKTESQIMAQTGLLIISNFSKVHNVLFRASQHVNKTLYVSVNAAIDNLLPVFSKQIVNIYTQSTSTCGNLDVRLLLKSGSNRITTHYPIQLVLLDNPGAQDEAILKQRVTNLETGFKVLNLEPIEKTVSEPPTPTEVKKYDYVALGGTFDRLHNGHKILLSEAVLRTVKHLTVGVTDANMIQSKKLWELIEPIEERINKLKEFLIDINPDIEYNVVPIQDMYGPTKDDPRLQLLVVSEETVRGGQKVNEKRQENGLSLMELHCIDLAPDMMLSPEEETKLSSSNKRMRLLGTMLRPPVPNPNIPNRPYVIGLAGGIASGKTKITERLIAKGAAVINCDTLAHELYKPGLPLNSTLAEMFGRNIITKEGEVDRRRLGQIVFTDKKELQRLNSVVWPAIAEEAERRVRALGEQGYKVVVMEAAVLVQARWHTRCHQLWAVIIPPEEAIKRLIERNGFSEETARERVEAQPSNSVQVAQANIVFSPYWSYEYTQAQVDKAWDNLQQHL